MHLFVSMSLLRLLIAQVCDEAMLPVALPAAGAHQTFLRPSTSPEHDLRCVNAARRVYEPACICCVCVYQLVAAVRLRRLAFE